MTARRKEIEIRPGDLVALHPAWSEARIHSDIETIGSIEDDEGPPGIPFSAREVALVTSVETLKTARDRPWGRALHVISPGGCGWIYYDYVAPVRDPAGRRGKI